uniref:Cyclin N-terminal domain-containing protein n=1 Tax=Hyaloperonospora arabidopsidis (strain Emoy2) TaxID=559515 RepID=M4BRN6_HYAAE
MAATVVHVPPLFRYRFTTKFPAASAVVRRWEAVTAQEGLLDARLFFSRGCGYPLVTSTIINYNGKNDTTARRSRLASMSGLALERPAPTHYDWRGTSYFRLLHATYSACDADRDREDAHPERVPYSANFLDDPEFRQGRHRHVVRGDKSLGPIVSSILLFVKPHELKDELNQKFQKKHAHWLQDPSLSLSKLRHLKREAIMCSQRLNLEVATVALACVLFEKLVLQHYVAKVNRKLYMAVCFLLAVKFNEPCASDERKRVIRLLLKDIDRVHALPSRDVLTAEFTVYAQLSFDLHVPIAEVHPHYVRLLKLIESNPRKYLDDDVFTSYSALLAMEEQAEKLVMVLSDPMDGFDETTDNEARLSDEEENDSESEKDNELRGRKRKNSGGASNDPSLFLWQNVSLAQWWRKRRDSQGRHESPSTTLAN